MSVFRRRREEGLAGPLGAAEPTAGAAAVPPAAATTVPVARDPELGVPPFRPVARDSGGSVGATGSRPAVPVAPSAAPVYAGAAARNGGAGTHPYGTPTLPGARSVGAAAVTTGGGGVSRAEEGERRTLVVGKGISLQGTVSDAERLVVEGTVESQMIQAAELLITHAGVFKGEVQIEDAEIAGTFDGTLTATGNLIIRATGKVMGVARCRRLQVEEGGQISGRMEMLTEATLAPAPRGIGGGPAAPAPANAPATALRSPEPADA
jgi:cytoskeletal protein CcmA (bactofilin family)